MWVANSNSEFGRIFAEDGRVDRNVRNKMMECLIVLLFLIKLHIKSKLTRLYIEKRYGEERFHLYKNFFNSALDSSKLHLDPDY